MYPTQEQLDARNRDAGIVPVVAKPVSVLSSNIGKDIVDKNTESIKKMENGYAGASIVDFLNAGGKPSDFASRTKLANESGVPNYKGTAEENTKLLGILRNISGSPASQTMIDGLNPAIAGGGLTSDEQGGLNNLTKLQDEVTAALAKARAALDAKDYRNMDSWTTKADENKKLYETQLADYYASTRELRDRVAKAMTPGDKEQELNKKLVDIRGQADAFSLQTEQDKFKEYEGQTLGFAGGRASEIDRLASFKNQEFLLKEKNLLASLGLEQDLRKMDLLSSEKQLSYLKDDYELQDKIQAKLDKQEEDLFNKADRLQDDAKASLISILNELEGVDPSKLDDNSLKQLKEMSERSGIEFNLVTQALQTQHAKRVFDDALKTRQENRLSENDEDGEVTTSTSNNFTDIMQQAIDAGATPEQAAREASAVSEASGIQVDQKTLNKWTDQARKLKKTPTPEIAAPVIGSGNTSKNAGKAINAPLKIAYDTFKPENLIEGGKDVAKSVGSFFEGLFGN